MTILKPRTPPAPPDASDGVLDWARNLTAFLVGVLSQAGVNTTSNAVTLTPNVTTTVVNDVGVTGTSRIMFFPTTASAAAELAAGGMFVSAKSTADGTFTITHANDPAADRTFDYAIQHKRDT